MTNSWLKELSCWIQLFILPLFTFCYISIALNFIEISYIDSKLPTCVLFSSHTLLILNLSLFATNFSSSFLSLAILENMFAIG